MANRTESRQAAPPLELDKGMYELEPELPGWLEGRGQVRGSGPTWA